MTINGRIDALQERLRHLEIRLKRSGRRLRRFTFLGENVNSPAPLLTENETDYIKKVAGFSSDTVTEKDVLSAYHAAALEILELAGAEELGAVFRQKAEIIGKFLNSSSSFSAKQIIYVTTQIILVLTSCIARFPKSRQEAAVARLEEMVDIEEKILPL